MPGTWLAQIARRYLHGETFALVVSPAIADMQFESPAGCLLRVRHYLAIWKALAGALSCDVVADLQSLRPVNARGPSRSSTRPFRETRCDRRMHFSGTPAWRRARTRCCESDGG